MENDITGKKFNRLTAIKFIRKIKSNNGKYKYYWLFKCDCGREKIFRKDSVIYKHKANGKLFNGNVTNCGCQPTNFRHGLRHTHFYRIYKGIINRCLNKKHNSYNDYGGRNIKICDRWLKFKNFRDDMYELYLEHVKQFGEKNTTIDRINNNGNYELNNCKWSTREEQANNKRNNHFLIYKNEKLTVTQWERKLNFHINTIFSRIELGWSIEKMLTTPIKKYEFNNSNGNT